MGAFMKFNTDIVTPYNGIFIEPATLPCLNRIISIEIDEKTLLNTSNLSTAHRKTAFILKDSIEYLGQRFGVEKMGFLTLTFRDHVTKHKEASKRLNSLISNVIKQRYLEYIGCVERMKSGRIHYHFLVVLNHDIKTGADFEEFKKCNYKSASKELRSEWAFWRKTAPKYRFGRTELLPVKSNAEAMGKYIGKYIAKHVDQRTEDDKGARLVRYSKGAKRGNNRFMFLSDGSEKWRSQVQLFATEVKKRNPEENIKDVKDLSRIVGKRWAYNNRKYILNLSPPG